MVGKALTFIMIFMIDSFIEVYIMRAEKYIQKLEKEFESL